MLSLLVVSPALAERGSSAQPQRRYQPDQVAESASSQESSAAPIRLSAHATLEAGYSAEARQRSAEIEDELMRDGLLAQPVRSRQADTVSFEEALSDYPGEYASPVCETCHGGNCHGGSCGGCSCGHCRSGHYGLDYGASGEQWRWHILPSGLIYRSYLAGIRESRMGSNWFHENGDLPNLWDITLGGRASILRYGTGGGFQPEGFEVQIEGAALPRLETNDGRRDLVSTDYRFGIPLVYGIGAYQMKLAYYHLSSHLGDEYIERTGATRINYVRDAFVWGHSYYWTDNLRLYGELGWAFHYDGGAEPWELQFGADWSPGYPTTIWGAPFAAVNAHLRQEVDWGGNFVLQAGWAWRGGSGGQLFRVGLQYYNGKSAQYEFFNDSEQQIGAGIWYDF